MSQVAHQLYDADTYTPAVLPKGLEKDTIRMIRHAVDWGWKVLVRGIVVQLQPPTASGLPVLGVSASNKNIPYQKNLKKIEKYGKKPTEKKKEKPVKWEEPPESGFKKVQEKAKAPKRSIREVIAEEVDHAEKVSGPDRHIVSSEPMLCAKHNGKAYYSETTKERVWSDGSKDYVCSHAGCTRSSDSRHSIRAHYRDHVKRGEAEPLTPVDQLPVVEAKFAPIYRTRKGLPVEEETELSELGKVLKSHMDDGFRWDDLDNAAEQLATAALEWMSTNHPVENDEAEEVLVKIRELVGVDTHLLERLEAQEAHVERLTARTQAAEKQAADAQATLEAFVELAKGLGSKDG